MSYEGYEQYICPNKHSWERDARSNDECVCPVCREAPEFYHDVETTNGVCESIPSSLPADMNEVGFEDDWRTDHYGNRYAIKIPHYVPANPAQWKVY